MLEAAPTLESTTLAELSAGERDVCELVLHRYTTKEIARRLGMSFNGVEHRVRSARAKLAAADRNDLVRIYSALKDCERIPVHPLPVSKRVAQTLASAPEASPRSRFELHDAGALMSPELWGPRADEAFSEMLDRRFGNTWRIIAIPLGALCLLVLLGLVLIVVTQTLGLIV